VSKTCRPYSEQKHAPNLHIQPSQIICFVSVEERKLVSATCRNAAGEWVTVNTRT